MSGLMALWPGELGLLSRTEGVLRLIEQRVAGLPAVLRGQRFDYPEVSGGGFVGVDSWWHGQFPR